MRKGGSRIGHKIEDGASLYKEVTTEPPEMEGWTVVESVKLKISKKIVQTKKKKKPLHLPN